MAELQARCEQQEKEIAVLRQKVNGGGSSNASCEATPRCDTKEATRGVTSTSTGSATEGVITERVAKQCDQLVQTEERMFLEQLDLVHKEAAQKGKELKKLQETVRLLREELAQEKVVGEQYRGQVEGLEAQLKDAMLKQHRAESERSVAEWRSQQGREGIGPGQCGRLSRSSTPQPGMSRNLIKAWAEPGRKLSEDGDALPSETSSPSHSTHLRAGSAGRDIGFQQQSSGRDAQRNGRRIEDLSDESAGEDSMSSEEGAEMEVFHPPPSRGGIRR